MPAKRAAQHSHTIYHKDGSVWARGQMIDGAPTGYWEWLRKDGAKLRSGFFLSGEQMGEWTTYDNAGKVHNVTVMKPKKTIGRKK
jgi:antitoxin component YwqK of YwqJK toxin-antitoxin module